MHKRRYFTAEFKRQLVEQTCQPGASIAGLAQVHAINANQLHKWRRQYSGAFPSIAVSTLSLLPITVVPDEPAMPPASERPPGRIDIELGRARVSLSG